MAEFHLSDSADAVFWIQTARSMDALHDVGETFAVVVRLGMSTVAGAEHGSVTVLRADGPVECAVASDDVVAGLERLQAQLDDGPGRAVLRGETFARVQDTIAEERWADFVAEARSVGIGSMLSCRIASSEGAVAALNLYAGVPDVFDDGTTQTIAILAAHAGIAVSNAEMAASVRHSAATRRLIGTAAGILAERHGTTSKQGLEMLIAAAQSRGVKVRDVADFVATGRDPHRFAPGHGRGAGRRRH